MYNLANRLFNACLIVLCLAAPLASIPTRPAPLVTPQADPWWDAAYPYRVRVEASGSGIVQASLNFTSLLASLGLNHALLDLRSLRVVPAGGANDIPYAESYSVALADAANPARWSVNDAGGASLDNARFTQGPDSIHAIVTNTPGGYGYPGVEYHPASQTNWSAYEVFLYDLWPQVNASALDQAPDLYWFKLYNACGGSAVTQGGPPLALDRWNYVSVSLNPLHTCRPPQLNLSSITRMEFHTRDNRDGDTAGPNGWWDNGDQMQLWFDNLRLVDQDSGALRWQSVDGASVYYVYFDVLTHAGHPLPSLNPTLGPATLTGAAGATESGGYYHQAAGASTGALQVWTAPTVEKILRTMTVPVDTAPLELSAARGEFEPFQIIVRAPSAQSLAVSAAPFTLSGQPSISQISLHRVDYVNITTFGDAYDRPGLWPDPLFPLDLPASVTFPGGQNQPLWFTVQVPWDAAPGRYTGQVSVGSAVIPVYLTVWDFTLPPTPHLDSEWGFDWSHIAEDVYQGYGNWSCYWGMVDAFKQDFMNHRLIPKGVAWPAGINYPGGVEYDCNGNLDADAWGEWDFATLGGRYIHGQNGSFSTPFNRGYGFPTFLGLGPASNDPADSLPWSFCSISRSGLLGSAAYQAKWKQYLSALDAYLVSDNYTNAYYHLVNEPQNYADYGMVGQLSALTHTTAPHLRQLLSEQVEPEIYNYPGAKIDIWMPTISNYEPEKSHDRQKNHAEQVWWYYLYGDNPPLPNPILMSHPGVEARLTPWLAYAERVDGLLHYSATDWSPNPWTTPNVTGQDNGDGFFFYPPNPDGSNLAACGANGNRLVPSIRWENLRDGMEDYEYLWLLSGDPLIGAANASDAYVAQIAASRTLYSHIPTEIDAARAALAQAIVDNLALPRLKIYLPLVRR